MRNCPDSAALSKSTGSVVPPRSSLLDPSLLAHVEPATLRAMVPGWLAEFIDDTERAQDAVKRLAALLDTWSDDTCRSVAAYMADIGTEHRVYQAHPACRAVARTWNDGVVTNAQVQGAAHLADSMAAGPTLVVCNHLSYIDANATDAVLARCGHAALADQLVAAAGPKVYEEAFRRFAAGCINTLPVPQSTTLQHTAALPARELARRAKAGLQAAEAALEQGFTILVYPEGARTRTGRLQSFVRGVRRWLSATESLRVVPMSIVGTAEIMPLDARRVSPGEVELTFGPAIQVGVDGTARDVLAASHAALGELLPASLQPPPGLPAVT